jgi:hypothetical protein
VEPILIKPQLASSVVAMGSRFVGAKGGAGVWQRIISEMPAHDLYVEAFAGTAQVLLHKRPAKASLAIDSDAAACASLTSTLAKSGERGHAGITVIHGEAISWLAGQRFTGRTLLYCDPPYLRSVRTTQRDYYREEFDSPKQHRELLSLLLTIDPGKCAVMLSGYRSALYDALLEHWRRIDYRAGTRGGVRVESLWLNFPPATELHDFRFVGRDFRERERLKRKKARWLARLEKMPALERAAVIAAIDEHRCAHWSDDPQSDASSSCP